MTLNPETLERLLIDRALGALSPDVEALLASHLEGDRSASEDTQQLAVVVETARRALQGDAPKLPPFPAEQLRRAQQRRRRAVVAGGGAAFVAAVAAGLVLGAMLFSRPPHADAPKSAVGRPTSVVLTVDPEAGGSDESASEPPPAVSDGFWSMRRWRERAASARHGETSSVRWDSPVKRPRFRGEI